MNPTVVSGTVVGTGADITIKCGFKPAMVELINVTSATKEELKWCEGMAQASGLKTINASRSIITTLGVSTVGGDGVEEGFTIGADTDVNVAAEVIFYRVTRSGPGAT
tara:strand:- start:37750 stop:38073 length:324 start_codon:yes stop_codon:yes gene_type:complete